MIFLTVGSELPFDRLVKVADEWSARHPENRVFGQINDPGPTGYRPSHFEWCTFLTPEDYTTHFDRADMIISHAGMGSIINALSMAKPILVMPRLAQYREHRNDHQLATATKFRNRAGVFVAPDESTFPAVLDKALTKGTDEATKQGVGQFADPELVNTLREFIFEGKKSRQHLSDENTVLER